VIERVGIVGAGTMGAGIAQVACLGGIETALHDPVPEALATGEERLRAALAKGAQRGRWSEDDARLAAERLHLAPALDDLAGCGLVIEAAPEDLELKRGLFASLADACGPQMILATNTSSLSVTAIASGAPRPERVVGMHFFNPPALMELVEIVAGPDSAQDALEAATDVARRMGRTPVRAVDEIGFLANRVARPFGLEALRLLGDRVATHERIDRICRIGGGFRMGPFELMDLVGVDVGLEVSKSFWDQSFHEPRWQPHPIQTRMVASGRHGRKSGRGYYDYSGETHRPKDPAPPAAAADPPALGDGVTIDGSGFRAVPLIAGSLAALAPGEDAVGYLALPPAADAPLVELARGPATRDATADAAERFFTAGGRHVEWVGDAPGLVLGRIVSQLVNEASFALQKGIGSAHDLDTAMRLGFNHPRGPLEWGEAIGLERVLAVLDALYTELGEERYRAAPLLRRAAAEQDSLAAVAAP
jgi:3-hydroxybutyryl-CoA dehydrogenase